jgi:hypothetical protein
VCKAGRLHVRPSVRPFVHHHRWDILLVVDIFKIFTLTLDLGSQLHASPYTCGCRTPSCSEIIIFTALASRLTPLRTQPQPQDQREKKKRERERERERTDIHRLNDSLTSGTRKKRKKKQQQLDYVRLQPNFF